eukprot:tig00021434_g21325.t1
MMIPIISSYSKRTGIAPSYLQMDRRAANVLLDDPGWDLLIHRDLDLEVGLLYLIFCGPILLPNRRSTADADAEKSARKFQISMEVRKSDLKI